MKKYTTDWRGITIIFVIAVAIWILGAYLKVQEGTFSREAFPMAVLIVAIPIAIGVLCATVFSYAAIDGRTLRYMYFLYQRRTIDIDSITDINDQPTYKVAKGQFRSLYVFYKDKKGDTKWIEFRITIFPEKTLGKLIKELKRINPRIELNAYSRKLMESVT